MARTVIIGFMVYHGDGGKPPFHGLSLHVTRAGHSPEDGMLLIKQLLPKMV
jgi:hypothetical protein